MHSSLATSEQEAIPGIAIKYNNGALSIAAVLAGDTGTNDIDDGDEYDDGDSSNGKQ